MTYDLHGSWDGVVGHHSPLYASSAYNTDKSLTVVSIISFILALQQINS